MSSRNPLLALHAWLRAGIDAAYREYHAWRIRCTTCGRDRPFSTTGGIRVFASGQVWTPGYCSACMQRRTLVIYHPVKAPLG